MTAMSGKLLATYSQACAHRYRLLLSQPDQEWTVRAMGDALHSAANINAEALRANLYLLLQDRLVELVRGEMVVTLRLTDEGAGTLRMILSAWRMQKAGGHAASGLVGLLRAAALAGQVHGA